MNPKRTHHVPTFACAALVAIAAAIAPAGRAGAQSAPSTTPSIANPAISVVGWFQAVSGNDATLQEGAFAFREAELAFQAAVDPYSRADFIMGAGEHGFEIGEATITWLALPGGAQAKVGKFRADLGKFNRTHPPETPFADRPLAAEAFLGGEGLATSGVALSALLPTALYWDVTLNVGTPPEESPLFEPDTRSDLLVVGRSSAFVPVGESADVNVGLSYANALAAADLRGTEGNRAQLATGDLVVRWKNPRRSIYRALTVQGEFTIEQGSADGAPRRRGGFGCVLYQFARRWTAGARYDWTERPGSDAHASGALALLTFRASEFSTLSLQARRVREDGVDRDAAMFKWTFNIGPHGAHPY